MDERRYLVKDVGDIVTIFATNPALFPVEYEIIAIDGERAWIRDTSKPRSMGHIVHTDRLIFVRSTVAQDFEPALEHAADPFSALDILWDGRTFA